MTVATLREHVHGSRDHEPDHSEGDERLHGHRQLGPSAHGHDVGGAEGCRRARRDRAPMRPTPASTRPPPGSTPSARRRSPCRCRAARRSRPTGSGWRQRPRARARRGPCRPVSVCRSLTRCSQRAQPAAFASSIASVMSAPRSAAVLNVADRRGRSWEEHPDVLPRPVDGDDDEPGGAGLEQVGHRVKRLLGDVLPEVADHRGDPGPPVLGDRDGLEERDAHRGGDDGESCAEERHPRRWRRRRSGRC